MNDSERILELSKYRLRQAEEALSEAQILSDAGHYRGSINRAYYAMFYALQILTIQNRAKVSKHTGVISFFDREYVKTGRIDKRFSKWVHRLFDLRQDADYGDMFEPSREQCREALEQATEFVQHIRDYSGVLSDGS